MFNKTNCNTSQTKGSACSDSRNNVLLKIIANKLGIDLDGTLSAINDFQSSLKDYCDLEGDKLTQIDNRLAHIIDINEECCDIINLKLEELFTVIETIDICIDECALEGVCQLRCIMKARMPTTSATVMAVWMICVSSIQLRPRSFETRSDAPNAMPAPAHDPPTCLMAWYMTNATRMMAKPTATGPRSRIERPLRCSHQTRPIESASPMVADTVTAERWCWSRLDKTA